MERAEKVDWKDVYRGKGTWLMLQMIKLLSFPCRNVNCS